MRHLVRVPRASPCGPG